MRKPSSGTLILLTVILSLGLVGVRHTSSSIGDMMYILGFLLGGMTVFLWALLTAAVAAAMKWTVLRNYALAAAGGAAIVAALPISVQKLRIESTRRELSALYETLSDQGPPFPSEAEVPDVTSMLGSVSHGYWVAENREQFEVFYHVGSDSYTRPYPEGQWEWSGNRYQGPEPSP